MTFTTLPRTVVGNNGGIIPFATDNGTDYATYDNAANTITAFTGYVFSLAAAGPGDIVKLVGQETLTANKTITGLVLAGGTASENGFTLTLGVGGLVGTPGPAQGPSSASVFNSNTIIGGTVAFGAAEGLVVATGGTILTINSRITGSGGVTLGGDGVINLPNANVYTGPTTLGGGVLNLGSNTALSSGNVNLVNGIVQGLAGVTIANPVTLNNSNVTLGGVNNLTFTGPVTLNNATDAGSVPYTNTVNVASTSVQTITLAGSITGGTFSVNYNNSGVNVQWTPSPIGLANNIQAQLNGLLTTGAGNGNFANFGSNSQTDLIGGPPPAAQGSGGPSVVATSVVPAGPNTFVITFTNTLAGVGTPLITIGNGLTVPNDAPAIVNTAEINTGAPYTGMIALTGAIGGAGSLNLVNQDLTGTIMLSGNNTYAGGTFVNGPTVVVASNTAFGAGTLTLTNGTVLADAAGRTLTNAVVINQPTTTFPLSLGGSSANGSSTSGSTLTFSGGVTLANSDLLDVFNTTTFSGTVSGPGGLIVAGPGNLVLSGTNTFFGGTVLDSAGGGITANWYSLGSNQPFASQSYVNQFDFNVLPTTSQVVPEINYLDNGNGEYSGPGGNPVGAPVGVLINNTVAALFNGYINIVTPGDYTFATTSDDASVLYIDGGELVDKDGNGGFVGGMEATVFLTAGLHTFQERYYQYQGGAAGTSSTIRAPIQATSSSPFRPARLRITKAPPARSRSPTPTPWAPARCRCPTACSRPTARSA